MMIKTIFFRFFYLIALSATISGCSRPRVALNAVPAGENHQTGGVDLQTGQPNTTALEPELPSPNTEPDQINQAKEFSQKIVDFSLSRLDSPFSLKLTIVSEDPQKTETLEWASKELGSQVIKKVIKNSKGSATMTCLDETCIIRNIELDFYKFKLSLRESRQMAQYQFTGNLETLKLMAPQSSARLLSTQNVWVTTKEVTEGFSRVSLFFEGSMCFSSALIRTNETDKPITFGCAIPKAKNLQAVLAGNSEQGQWFFKFSRPNSSDLFLEVTLPKFCQVNPTNSVCKKQVSNGGTNDDQLRPTPPTPADPNGTGTKPNPQNPSTNPTPVKPVPIQPALPPVTDPKPTVPKTSTQDVVVLHPYYKIDYKNPITAQLARSSRFDSSGIVNSQVITWTQQEKFLWTEYYKNMGRRLHEVTPSFDKIGVPHEFMFVTFWETDYFKRPNYVVSIGNDKEVGPWQFMYNTALHAPANLKIFPATITPVKTYQVCDQRAHLAPSSLAAAKYFKWLLNSFPMNPELAVLSYNWGIGFVNKAVTQCSNSNQAGCLKSADQIKSLDKAGFNFWTIVKYNMAPKVRIGYVVKLLAAFKIAEKSMSLNLKFAPADLNFKDLEVAKCLAKK